MLVVKEKNNSKDFPMKLDKVYINSGNMPLLDLINIPYGNVRDVGCGAGNNAEVLKSRNPSCTIDGITFSELEAKHAKLSIDNVWIFDIENNIIENKKYDVIVFSHVLEHLKYPSSILFKYSNLLNENGIILIAIPNVLVWSMRIRFLYGNFQYESDGIMDDTHLRFFTYYTADEYLLKDCKNLNLEYKGVSGSVPQWVFRRYIFPKYLINFIDSIGLKYLPNLFGSQVLLRLTLKK